MARTSGHGNPNWTRDETILALNLYFELKGKIPSGSHEQVQALSKLLRQFPYHVEASREDSFRNPDGVAFKLQNIRQVATGKGLGNVSSIDRSVWLEFGNDTLKVGQAARLICSAIQVTADLPPDDVEVEFSEGRVITELHRRRERNAKLRKRLLEARGTNKLRCDMCGCSTTAVNPAYQDGEFEAHHLVPLSVSGAQSTKVSDLALLCACCHRLIHRAIAAEKRWLDIPTARQVCGLAFAAS